MNNWISSAKSSANICHDANWPPNNREQNRDDFSVYIHRAQEDGHMAWSSPSPIFSKRCSLPVEGLVEVEEGVNH